MAVAAGGGKVGGGVGGAELGGAVDCVPEAGGVDERATALLPGSLMTPVTMPASVPAEASTSSTSAATPTGRQVERRRAVVDTTVDDERITAVGSAPSSTGTGERGTGGTTPSVVTSTIAAARPEVRAPSTSTASVGVSAATSSAGTS